MSDLFLYSPADDADVVTLRDPTVLDTNQSVIGATINGTIDVGTLSTPEAYWPLNEGSGTSAADATGHGYNGTVNLTGASWTTGRLGSALLRGASTAESMFVPLELDLGLNSSAAAWIYDGYLGGIVLGGESGHYVFYIDAAANTMYFSIGVGILAGPVAHDGLTGWHHLAVTRDGTDVQFYKDGAPLGTLQTLSENNTGPFLTTLGGYEDHTFPLLAGVITDDVRAYTITLTSGEIADLYALGQTGGATVAAPSTAYAITGETIATGVALTAPFIQNTLVGATIAAGSTLTVPTLAYGLTAGGQQTADRYAVTNLDQGFLAVDGEGYSQSFTGDGNYLDVGAFVLSRYPTTTGTVVAKVYASTGTHGTSAKPTGAALATSASINVASFPIHADFVVGTRVSFVFSGADAILLTNGVIYCLAVEFTGSGSGLNVFGDASSATHAGNRAKFTAGTWTANALFDFCFDVWTQSYAFVFAPTVAYAVTGNTVAVESTLTVPVVTPQAVTILGTTISAGSGLAEPTLTYSVVGITIAAGSLVTVPTMTAGDASVVGVTIASTAALTVPTLALTTLGATISVGSVLTVPTLTVGDVAVVGVAISTGSVLTVPTMAYAVVGVTVTSTATLTVPTITVGDVAMSGVTISVGSALSIPTVAYSVLGTTLSSSVILTVPTVIADPLVVGTTLASSTTLTEPSVAYAVLGVHVSSTVALTVMTVAYGVSTETVASVSTVAGPTVIADLLVQGAHIQPTLDDYTWVTTTFVEPIYFRQGLAGFIPGDSGESFAAEFTVGTAKLLTHIDLRMDQYNDPPDNVYLELRTSGRDGRVLGTSDSIVAASITDAYPASEMVSFTFSPAITVEPDTLYAWRLWRDGTASWDAAVDVLTDGSDPTYPPGRIDPAHPALVQYRDDPSGWVQDDTFGFQYQLHYAAGLFAPLVSVPITVIGVTLPSTSSLTVPVFAYAVTGATVASSLSVTVPTVSADTVLSVTGVTLASTEQVTAPTVAYTVNGVTVSSTMTVTAPVVTPGAVTVVGATLSAGSLVMAPSSVLVEQTVEGVTIAATSQVFAVTVAFTVIGATQTSSVGLTAPTVALTVVGATVAAAASLTAPLVAVTVVTPTLASGAQVYTLTVAMGVTSPSIAATSLFAPTISVSAVSVVGVTLSAGSVVRVPSVALTVLGTTVSSGSQVSSPSLDTLTFVGSGTVGSTTVLQGPRVSPTQFLSLGTLTGTQLFPARVFPDQPVATVTLSSTALVTEPEVAYRIASVTLTSDALTMPPTITVGPVTITDPTIIPTTTLFVPDVVSIVVVLSQPLTVTPTFDVDSVTVQVTQDLVAINCTVQVNSEMVVVEAGVVVPSLQQHRILDVDALELQGEN